VRRALTCRAPDGIPKALAFFNHTIPAIAPITPEDYFNLDVQYVEFDPPSDQGAFLSYLRGLPPDVHVGTLSQLRTYHEWDYHPEREGSAALGSAGSLDEIKAHVFPDLTDPSRYASLRAQVAAAHRAGRAAAGAPPHLGGELFESAWRLRGFENFMEDMVVRRPLAEYLLDQLAALLIHSALVLAQAGVDILLLDDDIAMPTDLLVSPRLWRELFRPRLAEVIQLARAVSPDLLVLYHSDGDFTRILPDLAEIGVNAINPVQPDCMDADAIKREYGTRLAIWGAVGTAWVWDRGAPSRIREEVRTCAASLGPEGLLLCPAYDVDFTPLENLRAFSDAVEELGHSDRGSFA
jgi:uroporphyrinogen decarboxylase